MLEDPIPIESLKILHLLQLKLPKMSAMSFKDTPHTHVEKAEASSQEGDVSRAVVAHMGDWDEAEEKALM